MSPRPTPSVRRLASIGAIGALWAAAGCGVASPDRDVAEAELAGHGAVYRDGTAGRYLLGGTWLLRLDGSDRGIARHWFRSIGTAGWRRVAVPHAWNQRDYSVQSMIGAPAWYRKDFRVPDPRPGTTWIVRFESVNLRARIWLNGRVLGTHTGAYLPFELRLRGLRPGVNRLVVRTDNRRLRTDFPPAAGVASAGRPRGGWWNYGGILREVYLRRVEQVDLGAVRVSPTLPCADCAATVRFGARVRSYAGRPLTVEVRARYGSSRVRLGVVSLPPGGSRHLGAQLRLAHPRLWSPAHPALYPVTLSAIVSSLGDGREEVARYTLSSGVRSIAVRGGRLLLNGAPTAFRGFGLHEQSLEHGAALTPAEMRALIDRVRASGATVIRAHYPLHPYIYELADRYGLLVWAEVPVYHTGAELLARASVRRAAIGLLRRNIAVNANHPSIFTWSVGNELGSGQAPGERAYIAEAARAARALDPTRPATIAFAGLVRMGCTSAYRPLQLLGVNDYFGWYSGRVDGLGPYLDSLRSCYPRQAIVVSEFGAEANRSGPATRKGTYEFQRRFVRAQLRVLATKPWLSGAIYWTIQSFRVAPHWTGGNPRPTPPWHEKGLVSAAGFVKPAFREASRAFHAQTQYGARK